MVLHRDGTRIPIEVTIAPFTEGKDVLFLSIVRDITERKRAEEALRYRVEFEDLVTTLSTHFINLAPDKIDGGINRALQAIGEFAGVDRSYVFLLSDDRTQIDNSYEWCAKGIEPQIDNLQGLPVGAFPWWMEKLDRFEAIHIPRVADLPPEASVEKGPLQAQDIQSLVVVPMVYGGALVGYLGFDSVRAEKTWAEDAVALLGIVGEIFVNALERKGAEEALRKAHDELEIRVEERTAELARANEELHIEITERKRAEEALRESGEKYRLLVENSTEVIIVAQDGMLKFLNLQAMEITGYSREELVSNPFAELIHPDDLEMAIKYYLECLQGKETPPIYDLRIIDKDGNTKWLESNVVLITWEGRPATLNFLSDITKRKRAMEALRQRNRDLALLNRVSQVFISTLDLDQVLFNVLEEVRHLLDVVASSAWLIDPATDELVCRQATGPQNEIVRGWRLSPGQGIVGRVAHSGESLIVPDVWADERHFKGVDQQTGLPLRSILSVPLRVARSETGHSGVIGVLQVVDTEVSRFSPTDLELLEPLVTTAAIAIENAQLYEQARRDAETRSTLLREVNHRVKNNLSAIIGLLYAERRYAGADDQAVYQSITQALVNRVQGLATVHSLLSASEWSPLRLSELATQVVRSSLQILPPDKRMSVDVAPSPVRVTPDQAHNLALVINELATNAVKHTLRERDTAHITVRVGLEGDMVLFEFRDDGPGYPEEILRLERHGVGFDLIQNVVRKNLRGALLLHNDHGAVAVIRFALMI